MKLELGGGMCRDVPRRVGVTMSIVMSWVTCIRQGRQRQGCPAFWDRQGQCPDCGEQLCPLSVPVQTRLSVLCTVPLARTPHPRHGLLLASLLGSRPMGMPSSGWDAFPREAPA